MPQGRPGAWAALVAITDLEAIDARFTGEIAQRRAERENGSAIILLRRVGYIGGNAKGTDLIGRTQVEQAIGGLARKDDGTAIDGIGGARFMIGLGHTGRIGAKRQAAGAR